MSADAFMDLLRPNLRALRNFVESRLQRAGHAAADDVVQQTLLRAFACRNQFQFRSAFKTWLSTIALNEIRQFLRSMRPTVSLNEFPNLEFADRGLSPLAAYERVEILEWLQSGLASLPEGDRTVMRLCLDDRSIAEIADGLAISRSAAKSHIFRARQRLGRTLRSRRKRVGA